MNKGIMLYFLFTCVVYGAGYTDTVDGAEELSSQVVSLIEETDDEGDLGVSRREQRNILKRAMHKCVKRATSGARSLQKVFTPRRGNQGEPQHRARCPEVRSNALDIHRSLVASARQGGIVCQAFSAQLDELKKREGNGEDVSEEKRALKVKMLSHAKLQMLPLEDGDSEVPRVTVAHTGLMCAIRKDPQAISAHAVRFAKALEMESDAEKHGTE